MKTSDLVLDAVTNSVRSKTRTLLTVIAIFIGAFTLTLTTAIGAGGTQFIDQTIATVGSSDQLVVTKAVDQTDDGLTAYDPDRRTTEADAVGPGNQDVQLLTQTDLDTLAGISGVEEVSPVLTVRTDYIEGPSGDPFVASVGSLIPGMQVDLAAGAQLDADVNERQVSVPLDYVEPLGFTSPENAIGQELTIGYTDATGTIVQEPAVITAVANPAVIGGATLTANPALTEAIHDAQSAGLPAEHTDQYAQATIQFDPAASETGTADLQTAIEDAGYTSATIEDQLGSIQSIISAVTLVLNGFALIALLAAGFGIVNTLLTSVQERTREIGLMKAMGLPGRKVFGLFSLEAVVIGFFGSIVGVGAALAVGIVGNGVLASGVLADLPSLTVMVFTPLNVATVVGGVLLIALLAGTVPAILAARKDPITALRHE